MGRRHDRVRDRQGSGKLYLAAILDLFSRFVVGWAVSAVNDRHLTIKALEMALKRRCPDDRPAPSLRPGQHVRERGLPGAPRRARHHLQHEPARQLLRQRGDGELLLDGEDGARRSLRQLRRGEDGSCSITSKCSITNAVDIRRSARSVRRRTNDARLRRGHGRHGKPHRTRFPTAPTPVGVLSR